VVGFDVVVGMPIGAMPCRRQQLLQDHRVGRRLIGHDLAGHGPGRADGPLKDPTGRPQITPWGDEHVDDLPELIDRTVDVAPPTGDLHIRLVDLPAITDGMAAWPGSLGQQGREALDPPVDGDVVDLHAAFGQQLLDVAVRQAVTQVPAHRQHDHIGREAEASERRPGDSGAAGTASSHGGSLPAPDSITSSCNSADMHTLEAAKETTSPPTPSQSVVAVLRR